MFGMFKKLAPDEVLKELVKNPIIKTIMTQVEEAHDVAKFAKDELIDLRRKVDFLKEVENNKSNVLPVLHFITTLVLAGVVLYDKF